VTGSRRSYICPQGFTLHATDFAQTEIALRALTDSPSSSPAGALQHRHPLRQVHSGRGPRHHGRKIPTPGRCTPSRLLPTVGMHVLWISPKASAIPACGKPLRAPAWHRGDQSQVFQTSATSRLAGQPRPECAGRRWRTSRFGGDHERHKGRATCRVVADGTCYPAPLGAGAQQWFAEV